MLALQQVGNLSKVHSTLSYNSWDRLQPLPPCDPEVEKNGWIVIELIFVRIQKNMEKDDWLFVNGA